MRVFLMTGARFLRTGWFWAFVLLALPNCALNSQGLCESNCDGDKKPPCEGAECQPPCEGPDCPCEGIDCPPEPCTKDCPPVPEFEPGDPASDAIVCELPAPLAEGDNGCATAQDVMNATGFSLSEAAIRLATGESKAFAFDWSPGSVQSCGGSLPRKISYLAGTYPDGAIVCLNCGQKIPAKYANPTEACVAKCKDLINFGGGPFPASGTVADYCQNNARTAVNYDKNICYLGKCTGGGTFIPGFVEPRREPEPVKWLDLNGVTDTVGAQTGTNTLTRNIPSSVPLAFDAGAASAQLIFEGDAWVEFNVTEDATAHALMMRTSPCEDPHLCGDPDTSANFGIGIDLAGDSQIYGVENGTFPGPFGAYVVGDRYRVKISDNHDGKATISIAHVTGVCQAGTTNCTEDPPLWQSAVTVAYPIRIDASIRDENATLTNVTVMRIIKQ